MEKLLILITIVLLLLCSCSEQPVQSIQDQAENIVQTAVTVQDTASYFIVDSDEEYTAWQAENPVYLNLDEHSNAQCVAYSAEMITIQKGGTYVLNGELNGSITVDVGNENVRLVLNGVSVLSESGPALFIKQADKAILSLEEGTQNTFTDTALVTELDEDAAIYSKDDLIINGTGILNINGNYLDGLKCNDDLHILSGSVTVEAKDDGIIGKDSIVIKTAELKINAGGDSLKADNDSDTAKGYIAIEDGTYQLISGNDNIQAETVLVIKNGSFKLFAGGGSSEAEPHLNTESGKPFGRSQQTVETTQENGESQKGLKAGTLLQIGGGTFEIDTCDDALHSNQTLQISDGTFRIKAGDDAVHADVQLDISGGEIEITTCYEGLESTQINIDNGTVRLKSSDDGINISGGNDSGIGGPRGADNFSSTAESSLKINGGYIVVDTSGDGIDINGSGEMNGGTVIVNGPTGSGNGSLDYDGSFKINGGIFVAAGSAGMAQAPSTESGQGAISMTFSSVQAAGTVVSLTDSSGNEISTFAPEKQFQSVIFSAPQIKSGSSYILYTKGTSSSNHKDGLYENGGFLKNGYGISFSASENLTYLNETGVTTNQNGGMMGGGKGNRDMNDGTERQPGADALQKNVE